MIVGLALGLFWHNGCCDSMNVGSAAVLLRERCVTRSVGRTVFGWSGAVCKQEVSRNVTENRGSRRARGRFGGAIHGSECLQGRLTWRAVRNGAKRGLAQRASECEEYCGPSER